VPGLHETAKVMAVLSAAITLRLGVPGGPGGDDGPGAGLGPGAGAAVTVKVRVADVPPPGAGVNTVTGTARAVARSLALSAMRSWVALTTVVARSAPFQRATVEATKPLPLRVSVVAALPETALAGDRLLSTGTGEVATTVNVRTADVPPPGAGVNTVTETARAVARSAVLRAMRSCVALTTVVVRVTPFQRTTEVATKLLPFTVSVDAALPAITLAGDRLLSTGVGDDVDAVGRAGIDNALQE
jgi:hypothetical protein